MEPGENIFLERTSIFVSSVLYDEIQFKGRLRTQFISNLRISVSRCTQSNSLEKRRIMLRTSCHLANLTTTGSIRFDYQKCNIKYLTQDLKDGNWPLIVYHLVLFYPSGVTVAILFKMDRNFPHSNDYLSTQLLVLQVL